MEVAAIACGARVYASSDWESRYDHSVQGVRLNSQRPGGAHSWCARGGHVAGDEFVHIGFVSPKLITGVATQGRADQDQWITQYNVKYTIDGYVWNWVENKRSFSGNHNRNSISKHVFDQPFKALSVRIYPTKWSGHMSMRCEVYYWMNRQQKLAYTRPSTVADMITDIPRTSSSGAKDTESQSTDFQQPSVGMRDAIKSQSTDFQLPTDKVYLIHQQSGKVVCPLGRKDNPSNNTPLVYNEDRITCTQFVFVTMNGHRQLQHCSSGKYVHTMNGRVGNNLDLVLYEGQDGARTSVDVVVHDGLTYLIHGSQRKYYVHPKGGASVPSNDTHLVFCESYHSNLAFEIEPVSNEYKTASNLISGNITSSNTINNPPNTTSASSIGDIEIIIANYDGKDVTELVKQQIIASKQLIVTNDLFGNQTSPETKYLHVIYSYYGAVKNASIREGSTFAPNPPALAILGALYGDTDVSEQLMKMNDTSFTPATVFGDANSGSIKTFTFAYVKNGVLCTKIQEAYDTVTLS